MKYAEGVSLPAWKQYLRVFLSLVFIGVVFYLFLTKLEKGMDITDESYYLLFALAPEEVVGSTTFFGYYTHAILSLVGHNLFAFRIIGALILFIAGFRLGNSIFKHFGGEKQKKLVPDFIALWGSTFVALSTWVYYHDWLVTPSYNWLNLVSILFIFSSMLNIGLGSGIKRNSALVGSLGVVCFMSKPTSSMMMGIGFLVWVLLVVPRKNWRDVAIFSLLSLLLVFAFHIFYFFHSPGLYFGKLMLGIEFSRLLAGGHTLTNALYSMYDIGLVKVFANKKCVSIIGAVFVVGLIRSICLSYLGRNIVNSFKFNLSIRLFTVLCLFLALWEGRHFDRVSTIGFYFIIVLFAYVTGVFCGDFKGTNSKAYFRLVVFVCLMVFGSYSYAFGTNANVLNSMSRSFVLQGSALYAISLYHFHNRAGKSLLILFLACILYVMTYSFYNAIEKPYRLLAPLSQQNLSFTARIGENASMTFKVDYKAFNFLNEIKRLLNQNNFDRAKEKVIDLSGGSPFINVLAGARFWGVPWLLGGYPGSESFVKEVLFKAASKDEIRSSWIVTCSECKRAIGMEVLDAFMPESVENSHKSIGVVYNPYYNANMEFWRPN